MTTHGEMRITSLESKGFTFPRGQVDGALAIERADIGYRARPEVAVSGLAANVSYGTADAIVWAPSETTIWISPLEVSWQ